MFKALLISLIFILSIPAQAENQKLWFQNSGALFSRDTLTNGKVVVESGIFGGYNLESLVSDSPAALKFAKEHATYNTYTHISFWSSLAVYTGLTLVAGGTREISYFYGGLGGFLGGMLVAGYFQAQSRHYLFEAINTYSGINVPQAANRELKMDVLSFNF